MSWHLSGLEIILQQAALVPGLDPATDLHTACLYPAKQQRTPPHSETQACITSTAGPPGGP